MKYALKRGDIVLITVPFSDLSSSKVRPALVLSSDEYNKNGRDAIFVVISSNVNKKYKTDLLIDQNHAEFVATGLKCPSLIRTDKMVILDRKLSRFLLGHAGLTIMLEVEKRVAEVLGIPIQAHHKSMQTVSNDKKKL